MDTVQISNRAVDKVIATVGDLPASPVIITTLMSLTADVNTEVDKISQALLADQSLTARLLKLSNSSFYGRAKEVRTIREAVVILGFKTLRSLVIAASTHSLYQNTSHDGIENKLWEHTLATAVASRLIARSLPCPLIEEAFIAGLLHDIGKLVLLEKIPDDYRKVIARVERTQGRFVEVERELLGFTHPEVGLMLLHKWSFPTMLADAVIHHHDPEPTGNDSVTLAHIVNLGNHLAKKLDVGYGDFTLPDLSLLPSARAMGFNAERLTVLEEQLAGEFDGERELFTAAV